ncbi:MULTISPECIES: ferritin-like domain-containing protein [Pseudomonas syringae group]|uniref:Iminophenyl-pyruvate dimer synthase domain-containing protein n=2 Tax=Pseudomonas syringae group TaxID=136849 RepID=A0A2K4WWB5_PSESX|nr:MULTISPECIES: ferritin-like protein [Pseudomonas syringae group]AVB14532.1 hypothetical protein BKM19_013700 [Pseudomonas amygdali pv. morsprunorum]KWS54706.1 hypothetical protein AL056_06580 [Pseudomonas amygdali pv. morsprunorum]KWS68350.1 hypothetical protein AL054_21030 [Pseudomonas amygdali pv. morsprunorum]MBI6729040.1 ferritin-like protein [Pseudomonas amygdali]MBI6811697.1 ferritin-like protein [Pseudomonas amygdali]
MNMLEQEKDTLSQWLHTAMTIELSTIPLYMTALISIKPGKNREAANILRGVMMEEMLHLSLAGNLLSAIGGKTCFTAENIPSFPLTLKFEGKRFKDREFEASLAPFSPESIDVFTEIELPEGWRERPMLEAGQEIEVPGYTIGGFYDEIARKLSRLCATYGEPAVFSGDPEHQLGLNYYWGGGGSPIIVKDLESALKAIQVIVTQGEGIRHEVYDDDHDYFDQPEQVAHFFRFREIQFGRHYQSGDNPRKPPTGSAFEVDYGEVYPIKANPTSADYATDPAMATLNDEFNRLYSLMLYQIAEALNGASDAMYTAILNSMHDMTATAREMVTKPIANDPQGRNGAPSFEWVEPAV